MADNKSVNCVVIGGTSGLGLSLARKLSTDYNVYATGRRPTADSDIQFISLQLSGENLEERLSEFVDSLPTIDLLIYAAGFLQLGKLDKLSALDIQQMMDVGLNAPIYLLRQILLKQGRLPEYIAITSTSQWTPRLEEPVYTAVKAGLAAFSNSLSLDERVGKTLVAAPAGMATNFWPEGEKRDPKIMLSADWVADSIIGLRAGSYSYKFAKILRQPSRVEVVEERAPTTQIFSKPHPSTP